MKELEKILASIEGYTGTDPLDLTPEETILISPRLSEAKTKLLAWRDKAVQEAIECTLVEIKSVEHPPSGKEWHFQDGEWRNTLSMAAEYIKELQQ